MARVCDHPRCSNSSAKRCYFCANVVCAEHATITESGVICYACARREHDRQVERDRRAKEAQAKAKAGSLLDKVEAWSVEKLESPASGKASGCLVARLIVVGFFVCVRTAAWADLRRRVGQAMLSRATRGQTSR